MYGFVQNEQIGISFRFQPLLFIEFDFNLLECLIVYSLVGRRQTLDCTNALTNRALHWCIGLDMSDHNNHGQVHLTLTLSPSWI